jgi:hypothetical protein
MAYYSPIQALTRPERISESTLLSDCDSRLCVVIINTLNALQTRMNLLANNWNLFVANPANKQYLALAWQEYAQLQYNLGMLAGFDPLYEFLENFGLRNSQVWADEIDNYWNQVKDFADTARANLAAATINP